MEQAISWTIVGAGAVGVAGFFVRLWMKVREEAEKAIKESVVTIKEDVGTVKTDVMVAKISLSDGNRKFQAVDARIENLEQNKVSRLEFESRMTRQEEQTKQNKAENKAEHEEIKAMVGELRADVKNVGSEVRAAIDRSEGATRALMDVASKLVVIQNPGQR
jgi:uncharacterized FlaG/YvyC family protein